MRKAPRKLFRKELLIEMVSESNMGVPIAVIRRKYDLQCSDTHLRKHIDYYNLFNNKKEVIASLFPPWLNDKFNLQEANDNEYKYVGLFPWGQWFTIQEWLQR